MKKIVIAIDGYSACGKSTTAKIVAAELGYAYIDTGAMYRAVTLYFLQHHIDLTNPKKVQQALDDIHITFQRNRRTSRNEICLNGLNVEDEIRKMYISDQVSEVSAIPEVRTAMVEQQQKMGRKRGVVMDGRDIGTRVFPDAELKVFMTADRQISAERRQQELLEKNQLVDLDRYSAEPGKARPYRQYPRREPAAPGRRCVPDGYFAHDHRRAGGDSAATGCNQPVRKEYSV